MSSNCGALPAKRSIASTAAAAMSVERKPGGQAQCVEQAFFAELLVRFIDRIGDPVGKEDQHVARLEMM